MNAVKRDPVEVGAYVLSPEAYHLSSFILFGALILICVILTVAFTDIPENTEIVRAFGYNNVCVYLDYPPAAHIAPTLWIFFLVPWMGYSLLWLTRCRSRVQPQGPVSSHVYCFLQVCTAFEVFSAAHFVQCFANKPHDLPYPRGLKMHTYPFTLLVIALWIMSCKSAWWFTNHEWDGSRRLKAAVWLFEGVYFFVTLGKVLIHVNFFLDDALWVANQAVIFGKLVDAAFMVSATLVVPFATWLVQYRDGDRICIKLHVEHIIEGEFDLRGRRVNRVGIEYQQDLG